LYGGGIYEKQQKKPINCILNINKKFNWMTEPFSSKGVTYFL
jgi:hypothetical protein